MQKVKIYQFDPEIYPFKLWIVITQNEAVGERFIYIKTKQEINTDVIKLNEALTYHVEEKETGYKGCLIVFSEKKYMSVKTITHEATHAARMFWNQIGESPTGEEADAYLVGWIAKCIDEVKHFKNG